MKFKSVLAVMIAIFSFGLFSASLSFSEDQGAANAPVPKVAASDANKDGGPDQWQYYENGQIIRTEADTNFDGKVDEIGYFSNGKLAKVEKDSDYDGKMDRWIEY